MCQVAHFSDVDVDDDRAEWTGDSRFTRAFHLEDMLARYEYEDDGFEIELDPEDDDDSDDDDDYENDDDE